MNDTAAVSIAATTAITPGRAKSRRPSPVLDFGNNGLAAVGVSVVIGSPISWHQCNALWRLCNKGASAKKLYRSDLFVAAIDIHSEFANLLAQGVPVDTEQFRSLDLVAPCCGH